MVMVRVRILTLVLVAVLVGGVFFAGYGTGQRAAARSADDQGFALLRQILAHVRRDYLNPVADTTTLFDGAARGMLEALGDPYTRYMDGKAFKEFQEGVQGVFFGIGIFIDIRDKQLIVVQPIEGTPAARAGLRAGDKIQRINNAPTDGMALQEAVSKIRGPAGTRVTLRIGRSDRTFDVEITRARIQVTSVAGAATLEEAAQKQLTAERLGYLRILRFDEPTADDVSKELDRILREAPLGLIIDLRGNGGGLLNVTEAVAGRFIAAGQPIVHVVDRSGSRDTHRAGGGRKVRIPIVVLVNEFSASAAEILAGALKDSAGATIIGQQTFGKGVIQSIYDLPGGSGAAITTAKYLTPAGRDIQGKGIPPDVVAGERLEGKAEADLTRIQSEQLQRAIAVLKQRLKQGR
jgi:carboxyl-terminal processing protease